MTRPRLLYVPIAAGVEAERVFEHVDWAETATFDSPGAGTNRDAEPDGVAGVVEAGRARAEELGWDRFGIVCDSHGQAAGIELALRLRDRVDGIFIGHAAARYRLEGDRPAMVPAMHAAARQLLETDYRAFGRAITQLTLGLADDEYVDRWVAEVPQPVARSVLADLADRQPELVMRLAGTGMPIVLGKHHGCVMWTVEAFADAQAAVPEATAVVTEGIPTQDPKFLDSARAALRI